MKKRRFFAQFPDFLEMKFCGVSWHFCRCAKIVIEMQFLSKFCPLYIGKPRTCSFLIAGSNLELLRHQQKATTTSLYY